MSDAYDACVDGLLENGTVKAALDAWVRPHMHPFGALFDFTGWDGRSSTKRTASHACGCITQVKGQHPCGSTAIRQEILRDPLIPHSVTDLESLDREVLERFAYYQRKLDAELGRPEPVWNGKGWERAQ